jgi:hypothetical protein
MPTEQVLLFLAALATLLFQLIRAAARERHGSEPAHDEGPPLSADLPQLPVAADGALSDAIIRPEREPARNAGAPAKPAMVRRARPGGVTQALRRPADLRRAIVSMTVLEPCRAIKPLD